LLYIFLSYSIAYLCFTLMIAFRELNCYMLLLADMRKAMPRDVRKESIIPLSRPVKPEELEFE